MTAEGSSISAMTLGPDPGSELAPRYKAAPPCIFVVFGAAGDLTRRLLIPALHNLKREQLLPHDFAILGVARAAKDRAAFQAEIGEALARFATSQVQADAAAWLSERLFYLQGSFEDPSTYRRLQASLEEVEQRWGTGGNRLFYLATPPDAFPVIVGQLGQAGLSGREPAGAAWTRIVVEKPFGSDLESARHLNRQLLDVFDEGQIYRIDHYLGKETVQNILVFRFTNEIFERLWNRDHIDHIQITVAETVGVEQRGRFYDRTGALRDMVPNHLLQLLALTAMEPPTCFEPDAVRDEKNKVLRSVRPFRDGDVRHNVVRGQYGAGTVAGAAVEAYRRSPSVPYDSVAETYVALKLAIDNWRWVGVPFYLRTGKALTARRSEIAIRFKRAPFEMFRDTPVERLTPNDLVLHLQPEEGITLRFGAKVPGPGIRMGDVAMRFDYADHFKVPRSTGYETLLYDCMLGDPTLFQRADGVEAGWRIVQPILDQWRQGGGSAEGRPAAYEAGTGGPMEADALLARDGRRWRALG